VSARRALPALLLGLAGLAAADDDAAGGVRVALEGPPPRTLSAWGLFADGPGQEPAPGVVPYDVNTPLFSDYARKRRFVHVPPGAAAGYRDPEPFAFPVGTVLVKTFGYPDDARDAAAPLRPIETRLLVRRPEGWRGYPYVWDAEAGEARLRPAGARLDVAWTDAAGEARSLRYRVPDMNQCRACHERGGSLGPIGPTARNLNGPAPSGGEPQLERWVRLGLLDRAPSPDEAPRLPVWDDPATGDLDARARAYLEVNCAHCHDPQGPGNTSGLDLRASVADPRRYGVGKPPVAAGRGSGGRRFDIAPGDPDGSILVHRMESTDPGVQMPELGRRLVHAEGVALIRRWIEGLE